MGHDWRILRQKSILALYTYWRRWRTKKILLWRLEHACHKTFGKSKQDGLWSFTRLSSAPSPPFKKKKLVWPARLGLRMPKIVINGQDVLCSKPEMHTFIRSQMYTPTYREAPRICQEWWEWWYLIARLDYCTRLLYQTTRLTFRVKFDQYQVQFSPLVLLRSYFQHCYQYLRSFSENHTGVGAATCCCCYSVFCQHVGPRERLSNPFSPSGWSVKGLARASPLVLQSKAQLGQGLLFS